MRRDGEEADVHARVLDVRHVILAATALLHVQPLRHESSGRTGVHVRSSLPCPFVAS